VHTTMLLMDVENLRHKWGWLLTLGIVMILLGTFALIVTPAATLASVLILSWILVFSGVAETIYAFRIHKWGGLFLHLIVGLLGIFVGLVAVTHPVAGALVWTLLFASFLTVIGVFRLIAAISLKFPHWGWTAFDGIVTLGLGILLWAEWPWSGLWFLGVALGVSLLFRGWSYVMFSLAIRSSRVPVPVQRAA
jgi:uncharacterized membrane protein HdeD (DUF308 family)